MRDLVLLVPDKNTEHTVRGALGRPKALGIRAIDFEVLVEQGRDGGVRRRGAQVLSAQGHRFSNALLLLDYEGSGSNLSAFDLEAQLDSALSAVWGARAKSIVIDPEVDVWMWGAETHLRSTLDWRFPEGIRQWLTSRSFEFNSEGKPARPKEALDAAFRRAQIPRSSARYEALAEKLSLVRCSDQAFHRLRLVLRGWFQEP
jgi:hypothetical protein